MNNPYQTPDSDVHVEEAISKTRWKVFFWVLLVLQVLSTAFGFYDEDESFVAVVLDMSIYTAVLVGIFGYAFDKIILNRRFWKSVIPVAAVYDVYYVFVGTSWSFESTEEMYVVIILFLVFSPLIVFQYLALYRYAFRATEIWDRFS